MTERTISMTPSKVLAKMRAGQVASCIKINLADPCSIEIAALCGFDCAWMDLEHVPHSIKDIAGGVRAAKAYGIDTMVRVDRGSYSDMIRPLEMDATSIMVPHVMSAEDAKRVAWYTKFHPVGRRPLDGGNADGAYCLMPMDEYVTQANQQRLIVVQIEDPEPLKDLDEIAATPGIDMLFFGPADFSQGIGAPGAWDDPRLLDARLKVAAAAKKHGKFAATAGGPAVVKDLAAMGYSFVSVGADVVGLSDYYKRLLASFGK